MMIATIQVALPVCIDVRIRRWMILARLSISIDVAQTDQLTYVSVCLNKVFVLYSRIIRTKDIPISVAVVVDIQRITGTRPLQRSAYARKSAKVIAVARLPPN